MSWRRMFHETRLILQNNTRPSFYRVLALIVPFIVYPLILIPLGTSNFGVFSTFLAIHIIGSVLDFGIAGSFVSRIADARHRGNRLEIDEIFTNSFYSAMLLVSLIVFAGLSLVQLAPIGSFDYLSENQSLDLVMLFSVSILTWPLAVIVNISQKLAAAIDRVSEIAIWNFGSALLTGFVTLVSSYHFESVASALLPQLFIPGIFGFIVVLRFLSLDKIKIDFQRLPSIATVIKAAKAGRYFFLMQTITIFSYQLDPILVATFLDTEDVAYLSLTWKIASIPYLLISMASIQLWSRTVVREGMGISLNIQIRDIFRRIGPIVFLWVLVFCIFGKSVILIWTNQQLHPPFILILSCAIWSGLASLMAVTSVILNARKLKFLIYTTIAFIALKWVLAVTLFLISGNVSSTMLANSLASIMCFFMPLLFKLRSSRWR